MPVPSITQVRATGVTSDGRDARPTGGGRDARAPGARPPLPAGVIAAARPASASRSQVLPVLAPLAPLFPDRGLRRGTTVVVETGRARPWVESAAWWSDALRGSGGATSLAMALIAAASAAGSWCVAVGLGDPGVVAAADLGIDLGRLAFVPRPGPAWGEAVAAALDGVDVGLVAPPVAVAHPMARRLSARARERRSVLVVLGGPRTWPEAPDLRLRSESTAWQGLQDGYGRLVGRKMTVTATGRRSATRPVRVQVQLPGAAGTVEATDATAPAT